MLKARILSALAIAPIFLIVVIFANSLFFSIFWAVIVFFAAREWAGFAEVAAKQQWLFAVLTSVVSFLLMLILVRLDLLLVVLILASVSLTWFIVVPMWLKQYAQTKQLIFVNSVLLIVGAIFLIAFAMAAMLIKQKLGGLNLVGLLMIVWCADIGAYFCGRKFGKHPLAPAISPKKTIEGFAGGVGLALIVAVIFAWLNTALPHIWLFLLFSILVISYATVGDLFESVLKRRISLKDSSQLIPGHGGVMDRIDSWLPSLVFWATWFSMV